MKRIMIVDDSVFIYEEMKRMLEESDFQVVGHATSGEEAVEAYRELKPDIVTMDIILPGIDGMEAIREIRKMNPEAKCLIVSSLAYDDTVKESRELGVEEFIYKPFEKGVLLEALEKTCAED